MQDEAKKSRKTVIDPYVQKGPAAKLTLPTITTTITSIQYL